MRNNILITGASSGLGRGMAREFAQRGRNLALCARRIDLLDTLRDELRSEFPAINISVRALDVNDHEAVFDTFRAFDHDLGGLDRVIVNAGMGKGQSLGTGHFQANKQTAVTNFVSALAQMEAALELFRDRDAGHLVVISSISAFRGMPRSMTSYAATKAGVAALAEGARADLIDSPITVSTIFPGYIRSAINERVKNAPFIVDTDVGCRLLARAIEKEAAEACVPAWPWLPLGKAMKHLPLRMIARMA